MTCVARTPEVRWRIRRRSRRRLYEPRHHPRHSSGALLSTSTATDLLPLARTASQTVICYSAKGMPSVSKFAQRCRVPIAILLLCLCAAGLALAQQSAAPAPPASSGKASATDFAAAADEVLAHMSDITHLQPRAPLNKTFRSREEIRAHVIQQMNEDKDPAERYAGARSAEAFGLLPKGFDLDSFMIDLLTEQVAGLYDPKAHEFYVADWIDIADQRRVMAHEL